MKIKTLLERGRTIRVLGVDDAAYVRNATGGNVSVAGVVCAGTRFEGMLWSSLAKDGMNATDAISRMILNSKFHAQLHLVLLDGITFGGANVVDLPKLHQALGYPVVAVMRRPPNIERFRRVLSKLPEADERLRRTDAAGTIHSIRDDASGGVESKSDWVFQCCGDAPQVIAKALSRLTDTGKVPEALRIAHLIGSAVMLGESTCRA